MWSCREKSPAAAPQRQFFVTERTGNSFSAGRKCRFQSLILKVCFQNAILECSDP